MDIINLQGIAIQTINQLYNSITSTIHIIVPFIILDLSLVQNIWR